MSAVQSFEVRVPESDLDDLRRRLATARLPERETVRRGVIGADRWRQGVPLAELGPVVEEWRTRYDWRSFENTINRIGQFRTSIDDLGIHFLHRRSTRPDAVPLIITHGWPGSIVEFVDVIDTLADPDDPADPAFHVVVPSLPGFGFSDRPSTRGWGIERIAAAWVELMGCLGYDRFLAHGGDWGGVITTILGGRFPEHVIGIHPTVAQPPPGLDESLLSPEESLWVHRSREFLGSRAAYAKVQESSPQTVGYGLVDSPVAQLAWILEKFAEWTDTDDSPFETIPVDKVLDNATLYWLTATGASAARIYTESHDSLDPELSVEVPAAITSYPKDIERWPRVWAQQWFRRIVRWCEPEVGGHFPSLEIPDFFIDDLRAGLSAVLDAGR